MSFDASAKYQSGRVLIRHETIRVTARQGCPDGGNSDDARPYDQCRPPFAGANMERCQPIVIPAFEPSTLLVDAGSQKLADGVALHGLGELDIGDEAVHVHGACQPM